MRYLLLILIAQGILFLSSCSCNRSNNSQVPQLLTSYADNWCESGLQTITVTVNANNASLGIVMIRVSRNHWPDSTENTDFARGLIPTSSVGNLYTFTLPPYMEVASGQRVIFRAEVTYNQSDDDTEYRAISALDTIRMCCGQNFESFLLEDQEIVTERFGSFDSGWPGFPGGYFGDGTYRYQAAHGKCCYAGMGVALARVDNMNEIIWGYPNVLLYAPAATTDPASTCDQRTDFGYTLLGWGYAIPYDPGNPPEGKCIPFEEWFVHEAGYHYLNSGAFCPTPPIENSLGENAIISPEYSPVDCSGTCNGCPRQWHTRLWDFHIWRNADGVVPDFGIFHPNGQPATCSEIFPPGSFFFPELTGF